MTKSWEEEHNKCQAYKKRWHGKDIFEYGENMLDIENKDNIIENLK